MRLRRIADGVVAGTVGLLAVATLAGFLDRLTWLFELPSFFRLQYAVVLALTAAAALALRRFRLAAAAAVLAGINVAAIAPRAETPATSAPPGAPKIRVVSYNVDAANRRFETLDALVADVRPDVLGLTELTPAWARTAAGVSQRLAPVRLVPRPDAYGLGVLSSLPPHDTQLEQLPADGPPALVTRFSVDGTPVTFVLVHVHTPFAGSVHVRELEALAAERSRLGERLVVCGDFNTVTWSAQLRDLQASTGLRDVFADSWPVYSWPTWSPLLRLPLDHCLVSDGLAVVGRRFGPGGGSDHFPLIVDLAVAPLPR